MTNTLNLHLPSTAGSLDRYIEAVNRMPLLSLEREQELARRFHVVERGGGGRTGGEAGDGDSAKNVGFFHFVLFPVNTL